MFRARVHEAAVSAEARQLAMVVVSRDDAYHSHLTLKRSKYSLASVPAIVMDQHRQQLATPHPTAQEASHLLTMRVAQLASTSAG